MKYKFISIYPVSHHFWLDPVSNENFKASHRLVSQLNKSGKGIPWISGKFVNIDDSQVNEYKNKISLLAIKIFGLFLRKPPSSVFSHSELSIDYFNVCSWYGWIFILTVCIRCRFEPLFNIAFFFNVGLIIRRIAWNSFLQCIISVSSVIDMLLYIYFLTSTGLNWLYT